MGRCDGRDHRWSRNWAESRYAAIGAAAGAAAGALTGKIVQENQVARYGPPPPGGYPFARWAGPPSFYYSP